jgi:hypothetical protein
LPIDERRTGKKLALGIECGTLRVGRRIWVVKKVYELGIDENLEAAHRTGGVIA